MISLLSLFLLTSCENTDEPGDNGGSTSATTTEGAPVGDPSNPAEPHTHAYGEWITLSEATCKRIGRKERVCSCGSKESETVDIIPHEYVNNVCSMCKQSAPSAFVPDYAAGQANVVGNDNASSNYALQGSYIYFSSDGNKINKMKTDRTGLQTVYKVLAGKVFHINVVGDWIYFYCEGATVGKSYIARVKTDGSGFEKIVSSVCICEMLVARDIVYYTTMPEDGKYKDYAKDVMPLYSVSVNGGTPKQLHDGAVRDMVADSTYIYFVHATQNGKQNISRIKHGSTSSSVLLTNKETFMLSLENSKLYFFVIDKYSDVYSLASISTSGGSYTVYGKVMQHSEAIHVVGSKVYYMGGLYSEDEFLEEAGLVEYDLRTKSGKIVRETYESFDFEFAGEHLIFENYNYDAEKLESLTIYYTKTNTFKEVRLP